MSNDNTPTIRDSLEAILRQAQGGNLEGVVEMTQQALQSLASDRLLTTREAAQLLGIRSVNTLKALVIRNGIPYRRVGNRMMLPLAEVEQLRESSLLRGLRASESIHDTIDDLGTPDGLTAAELADIEAARPGRQPWKIPAQEQDRTASAPSSDEVVAPRG